MIAQVINSIRRPICPTFIHDDQTKIIISLIGICLLSYILYRILNYFNS